MLRGRSALSVQCDVVISPPVELLPIKSFSLLSDRDARDVWPDF